MTMQIAVNGTDTEINEPMSVQDVVAQALGRDSKTGGRGTAVAVNNDVVPRGSWATTRVNAGDQIEILTATQGG